jgi:hypothetical protein
VNRYADNMALLKNERAAEIKTFTDYLSVAPMIMEQKKQALLRAAGPDGKPLITTGVTTTEKDEKGQPIVKQVGFEENNYKLVEAGIARTRALLGIELAKSMVGPAISMADKKSEQEMEIKNRERLFKVGNTFVEAIDKERASKAGETIKASAEAIDGANQLTALYALYNASSALPMTQAKLKSALESVAGNLGLLYSKAMAMGAYDAGTAEKLKEIIPVASKGKSIIDALDTTIPKIKTFKNSMTQTMSTAIKSAAMDSRSVMSGSELEAKLDLPDYSKFTSKDWENRFGIKED